MAPLKRQNSGMGATVKSLQELFIQNTEQRVVIIGDTEANGKSNNKVVTQKYTKYNFVFKVLLQQFSRHMNRYFLLIACLQLIREITPVEPITTWGPLGLVLLIAAFREAVDDLGRRKADKIANNRIVTAVVEDKLQEIAAQEVRLGSIVFLESDAEVPCDLALLQTSNEGYCFIQTTNLDGETDLKSRVAPPQTQQLSTPEVEMLRGKVECAHPNAELYIFDSTMHVQNELVSLTSDNLLLQGCRLRNTEWVYGVAVYTGNETKIGMNHQVPESKWTRSDKLINIISATIFCAQLCIITIFGVIGDLIKEAERDDHWYLGYSPKSDDEWYDVMVIPGRFLLLGSVMIPISLKVTIDVCKYWYAVVISWDAEMVDVDPSSDTGEVRGTRVRDTSISEDLGRIEYILTDKTGTLTENEMTFKKCTIDSVAYGSEDPRDSAFDDDHLHSLVKRRDKNVLEFFRCLAICNTVHVSENKRGHKVYKGSSPDEEALVEAAAEFNVSVEYRDNEIIEIDVAGLREKYLILNILEFSSDRKRMSVVVENQSLNEVLMYTKGADDVIFARVGETNTLKATMRDIERFADIGLRTLCMTVRKVSSKEYKNFSDAIHQANLQIEDRAKHLAHVYETLEHDLDLIGATAIEDRLQDQVPETIQLLRDANIKLWMLTGDKHSTARQVAISCNLISNSSDCILFEIVGDYPEEDIDDALHELEKSKLDDDTEVNVLVHGMCLKEITGNAALLAKFEELTQQAKSVICCRVTPSQKADIVKMVRKADHVTLAIGDGGNDVAMLQAADVGVGIRGKEGMQAARSSDYAFGRFRFLSHLLLVHGQWAYHRSQFIAQYSFYKSIFLALLQISYNYYTQLSGTSYLNSYSLFGYNTFFTGINVFIYALDQNISRRALFKYPQLYHTCQASLEFNARTFGHWILRGIYHTILICAFGFSNMSYTQLSSGNSIDLEQGAFTVFVVSVFLQTFTFALETNYWTRIHSISVWGVIGLFYFMSIIYTAIPTLDFYFILFRLLSDPAHYLLVVLGTVMMCLPPVLSKLFNLYWRPSVLAHIRFLDIKKPDLMYSEDEQSDSRSSHSSDDEPRRRLSSVSRQSSFESLASTMTSQSSRG
eukprot:GFYU01003912.1.p1 GENE.GFYU01003912.1~~GFYU01003912.1.p1  ORF type:complete len:1114 (+),score=366.13 GFYU01003912.1:120-3461(+)